MKNIVRLFATILMVAVALVPMRSVKAVEDKKTRQKVIAIVLDDSTSMVRDDYGDKERQYKTRWIEADYAVRALAAMMEDGDILKVFPLNKDEKILTITIDSKDVDRSEYEKLVNGLDEMDYHNATLFDRVKMAADYLKEETERDCFLVVITDGNFKKQIHGEDMSAGELTTEFKTILEQNPRVKIKYIQIGENSDNKYPTNKEIEIYKDTSSGGVTQQITDVINEIYDRVIMEKNSENFEIDKKESSITIRFDIPVKSVTIFLQNVGKKSEVLDNIQYDVVGYNSLCTFIHSTKKDVSQHWDSNEKLVTDWIKYQSINGAVLSYVAPMGTMEPITIRNLPEVDGNKIQIYYEPAVEQQIIVRQNNGDPFIYQEEEDCIFVEGELEITVEYQDLMGKPILKQDASLLNLDSVVATVRDRAMSTTINEEGNCVYSGVLEEADSGGLITISNTIGLHGGAREIPLGQIYEPYVDISVELAEEKPILTLDESGRMSLNLFVRDAASGRVLNKDFGDQISIFCESKYFECNNPQYVVNKDGSISVLISIKNPKQHEINKIEDFHITVTRDYDDNRRNPTVEGREPATSGEVQLQAEITSLPHELSIQVEAEPLELMEVFLFGGEIPISYLCDREKLTEEQRENLDVTMELAGSMLEGMAVLENDIIKLDKRMFRWLDVREEDSFARFCLSYEKWNVPIEIELDVSLPFIPAPRGMKVVIISLLGALLAILIILITLIIMGFLRNGKADDFIDPETRFFFKMKDSGDGKDNPEEVPLYWLKWHKRCFWLKSFGGRYAHVIYSRNSSGKDADKLPAKMEFYIAKEDGCWRLGKRKSINELANTKFSIGGKSISMQNCMFYADDGLGNRLEYAINNDCVWQLVIK